MTQAGTGRRALVVGVTGIVGQAVARSLMDDGWTTYGLSRSGRCTVPGVTALKADLSEPAQLDAALEGVEPDMVAITAWTRMPTEAENIAVNGGAVRNLLSSVRTEKSVRHVCLMTGLKHYLGPFEAYAVGKMADTPFREEEPRLDSPNFYYAQEDELFAAAERDAFTWSVHRSHTVFGFATGNAMNMVATICAYAAICHEQGLPFVFPGSKTQWDGLTDVTDAGLLAEQMLWCAIEQAGQNEAFNIANGDVFRWRALWPRIAEHFDVAWEGFQDEPRPLEAAMAGMDDVWAALAAKHDLVERDLARVASWWHTDGDLGRNIEVVTDMNKSRTAGFTATRDTRASFLAYAEQYRAAQIIP